MRRPQEVMLSIHDMFCDRTVAEQELSIRYSRRLRKAPFRIELNPQILRPLLSEVGDGNLNFGDFSRATFVVDAQGDHSSPLAVMSSKYAWDPLVVKIHGGSIYARYLDALDKTQDETQALAIIQSNLPLILVHEILHYYFKRNMSLIGWLLLMYGDRYEDAVQQLFNQKFSGNDEDFACEILADWITAKDDCWSRVAEFSVNKPKKIESG